MEKHRTAPKMLEPTIQLYHVITMLYCYKLYPCYIQLLMHSARRFQFLLARPSKAAASSRDCSDCSEAMDPTAAEALGDSAASTPRPA